MPTDYAIVPLGRRMHYEITADKSVLHSRGQPTAFMNENLYCSPANRSRARSTPRRPRTDAETRSIYPSFVFNPPFTPPPSLPVQPSINRVRFNRSTGFLITDQTFSFFRFSVFSERYGGTSRNLESSGGGGGLNPFNPSLSFTE